MMKKKMFIVLGLVTVLVFSVLSAYPALANAIYNIETVHIEKSAYNPELFTVSDVEKSKAKELALNDPRVKELLSDKRYTIVDFGPATFTSPDNTSTKYGVFIRIEFEKPNKVDFSYPDREYKNRNLNDFDEVTNSLSGVVEAIGITVDMNNGKIERIIPIPKLTPEIFDPLP
jgi:hypothetical protein